MLHRPAFLTGELRATFDFRVQCELCFAVADMEYFYMNDWFVDNTFDEYVLFNKALCKNCELKVAQNDDPFVAHCGYCERPLWKSDYQSENAGYQGNRQWDSECQDYVEEFWCALCNVDHSSNVSGV